MEFVIVILLLFGLFGSGLFNDHCPRRCGGFFSRHDCDHCTRNDDVGCLTWIIGAIILLAILN